MKNSLAEQKLSVDTTRAAAPVGPQPVKEHSQALASAVSPALPFKPVRVNEYDQEGEDDSPRKGHARTPSSAPLLSKFDSEHQTEKQESLTRWQQVKAFRDRNYGLLLVACSQVFFACMAAAVAYMSQLPDGSVPTSELIAVRMVITALCCHLWLRRAGDPNPLLGPPGIRLWLAFRGFAGFFGLLGGYTSLRYLPLADSVVLGFFAPSLTGIVAAIVLHEPYRPFEALMGVVSFLGVGLIAKPSAIFGPDAQGEPILVDGREVTDHERVIAVGFALVGCFGAAGAYVTIRKIGTRASPTHSILYFSVWSTFLGCIAPFVLSGQTWILPQNPLFVAVLLAIGLSGFFGQVLLTKGMASERAGRGSLATFLQMPCAIVLQWLLFGRTMDVLSFFGATIILAASIGVLLSKNRSQQAVAKGELDLEEARLSQDDDGTMAVTHRAAEEHVAAATAAVLPAQEEDAIVGLERPP